MTLSFYLTRPNTKTETGIYARICFNGNQTKFYIPERINPKYWNKVTQKARLSEGFKEYAEFNTRLQNCETTIKNVYRTFVNNNGGKEPSVNVLKNLLDKEFNKTVQSDLNEQALKTFWGFFDDFLIRSENGTRVHIKHNTRLSSNTIKNFKSLYSHLKVFEKKFKRLDFDLIDLKFHRAFTDYTAQKGLSLNTTGKLITNLKVVLKEALDNGYNTSTVFMQRKFKSYQVVSDKVYLKYTELDELYNFDFSNHKKLEKVRDLFIILCHTGVRFSDRTQLISDNLKDGIFKISQTKTSKPAFIPTKNIVREIFYKYEGALPFNISNQKFNKYIKEACRQIPSLVSNGKANLVGSHTARRSFATNEYLLSDLLVREIMDITGHETEKSFFKYIRMTPFENAISAAKKWQAREARLTTGTTLKAV